MELIQPPARALLALSVLLSLSCASGVGDSALDGIDSAASVTDPGDGEDDATVDDEGWVAEPMLPETGPSPASDSGGAQGARDAGTKDAGGSVDAGAMSGSDAGRDAGMTSANDAGLDAGSAGLDAGANDAGSADAGRDSGAQRDSGSGGGTPGGGTPGGGASCNPANCEGCSVVGPFPCCRENNTCGCTWAPGGYCL